MAGVLDALASYVTNMLADMAREELAMLIGVSGRIDDLSVKLTDLNNFLADADRRNITDESVQGWVEELKRAMYHATDILDLCQLKVMEQGTSKGTGCLNPLLFCLRNPLHAHDIGSRIKALNEKLDDIYTRGHSFSFAKLEAYQDRRTTTTRAPPVSRKTDPLLDRSGVVGEKIEEDTRALVEILTREAGDGITVVAIVGIGGIGKTTLAKKVFNDQVIQDKFTKKIWLSITREFNEVDLLRTAITVVEGDLPGPGGGSRDKALLVPALASAIRDMKLFLVLDDMWGTDEWTNLLKAPISYSASGSRVLVTTRHEAVARGMRAVQPYHHMDKLGPEDGWSLLSKQVLETKKNEPAVDMLKDIGLKIVEKCDGLPLAIKVIGGLLCQKEKVRRDWENILNNDIWSVSQMPEELNYAFYLSYEDLSTCLKQCFLHFSLKPKKTIIYNREFIGMWIGEGFVHGNSDRLEEIGFEYHRELLLRNLIEPDTDYTRLETCHMHDVVRAFAHFVARHEALATHNGEIVRSQLSLQRFLRLSIESKGTESDGFEWRYIQEQKSLRSLILIGNFKVRYGDSFNTFSSLRALHIEHANVATLVESLYQLKHLRYLSLKECKDIRTLPENIQKMKFLQHIGLNGCENLVKLPDRITMLGELRFLCTEGTSVNSMPRGFSALTNLRTLHGFRAHMDNDWCSLQELGPLSDLRDIELVGLEGVSASSFATKARLGEKMHLTKMVLSCKSILGDDGLVKEEVSERDQGINEEVFYKLYPPPCIEDISINGYFGYQLPSWMMLTATRPLQSLRTLEINDLACCSLLPDGLCVLQCLEFLVVNRAPAITRVGPEFLQGRSHFHNVSSKVTVAFPTLHKLNLVGMVEWEEWDWGEEVEAMPVLEKFFLRDCKLRHIPLGLASHARALKELTIWNVQQLHSLSNIDSVVELKLHCNPDLTRVSNFPKLQKLWIYYCPKLESLQDMAALRRLVLTIDYSEKRLPSYLQNVKPSHLLLECSPKVLASVAAGKFGTEWEKFNHIQQVEAYSDDNDQGIEKRRRLFYTSEPYSIETNIEPSLQVTDSSI
uniref:Uncharacterized protein n=1 Tax=Avena sativa TaxID=4498 RepID=A0ACD5TSL1_AVESA